MNDMNQKIDIAGIDDSIRMLKENVNDTEIEPLIAILEKIKLDPQNEDHLVTLTDVMGGLGISLGAVITYAPYVNYLVSKDLLSDIF